jgi:hypothetical protein
MLVALAERGESPMRIAIPVLAALICFSPGAVAQQPPLHGLWVWKTPTILDLPARGEALRDFCRSQQINEVYLSFSSQSGGAAEEQEIQKLIALLHKSHIRVEALLSSTDADEPGKHRDKLMAHVSEVLSFNREHAHERFDGIHLRHRTAAATGKQRTRESGILAQPAGYISWRSHRSGTEPVDRKRRHPKQIPQG